MAKKLFLFAIFSSLMIFSVFAAPDQPHRVFGEVTDKSGNPVKVEGTFQYQGERIKDFETDSNGNYDVYIPNQEYEDKISILVEEEKVASLTFSPLGVSEKNFEINEENDSEKSPDTEPGGPSGGFAGSPSNGGQENETEDKEIQEKNSSINSSQTRSEINSSDNVSVKIQKSLENISSGEEVTVNIKREAKSGEKSPESSEQKNSKSPSYSIRSVSFTSTSEDDGNISITESKSMSEEIKKTVDKAPEGQVYSYISVETNVEAVNATFEFEIAENKLSKQNTSPEQIVQERYNGKEWESLETEYLGTRNGTHQFQAFSPEGFSVFAITTRKEVENTVENEENRIYTLFAILAIVLLTLTCLGAFKREEINQTLQKVRELDN